MKISVFHQQQRQTFREQGLATPGLDSRLLVCHACNMTHEQFILQSEIELGKSQQFVAESYQKRRLEGEPVSRILGYKEFWGRDFLLGSQTLDPRPDTETLVGAVLSQKGLQDKKNIKILDLGTGTGAILLTLLLEWPKAVGVGVDKSREALDVAKKNADLLGCSQRVTWLDGNWFENVKGCFDLIVSHPPYIISGQIPGLAAEVAGYDPILALDGGQDGVAAYRDIIRDINSYLMPGGMVVFELGEGQYNEVMRIFLEQEDCFTPSGFDKFNDLAGVDRCILAKSRG